MKLHIMAGTSVLALGACAYEPTPLPVVTAHQSITDPNVVSSLSYQDPLAGYTYRGPTGPRDWRSVNQEQSEGN